MPLVVWSSVSRFSSVRCRGVVLILTLLALGGFSQAVCAQKAIFTGVAQAVAGGFSPYGVLMDG